MITVLQSVFQGVLVLLLATPPAAVTAGAVEAGIESQRRASAAAPTVVVDLNGHQFGRFAKPERLVAHAAPDSVVWYTPPGGEGARLGPAAFEVAANGEVWVHDPVDHRLLMWQNGRMEGPARVVQLPVVALLFAVGPAGTIYAVDKGTPQGHVLYSLTSTGTIRWQAPLAWSMIDGLERLATGPDGTLYAYNDGTWMPVATPAAQPLSIDDQRRLAKPSQPLPGGRRLAVTWSVTGSQRQARITLVGPTGNDERVWLIKGGARVQVEGTPALPALVGHDPVFPVGVARLPLAPGGGYEYLVLRLTSTGAAPRIALDNGLIWGDSEDVPFRVGPDGALYQLRTSPQTGISVLRYRIGTVPAPTPSAGGGGGGEPTSTPPSTSATPATSPTPQATTGSPQSTPIAAPADGSAWPRILITLGIAGLAATGLALTFWYRRQRTTG